MHNPACLTRKMFIVWVFAATLDYPSLNSVMAIETPVKREYQGRQMGVDIQITLYGDQEEVANQAAAAALDRIGSGSLTTDWSRVPQYSNGIGNNR